jgi:hypothetical protein
MTQGSGNAVHAHPDSQRLTFVLVAIKPLYPGCYVKEEFVHILLKVCKESPGVFSARNKHCVAPYLTQDQEVVVKLLRKMLHQ